VSAKLYTDEPLPLHGQRSRLQVEEIMQSSLLAAPGFLKNQKPVLTTSAPEKIFPLATPLWRVIAKIKTRLVFFFTIIILSKLLVFGCELQAY
jgi:hypothetical protein